MEVNLPLTRAHTHSQTHKRRMAKCKAVVPCCKASQTVSVQANNQTFFARSCKHADTHTHTAGLLLLPPFVGWGREKRREREKEAKE